MCCCCCRPVVEAGEAADGVDGRRLSAHVQRLDALFIVVVLVGRRRGSGRLFLAAAACRAGTTTAAEQEARREQRRLGRIGADDGRRVGRVRRDDRLFAADRRSCWLLRATNGCFGRRRRVEQRVGDGLVRGKNNARRVVAQRADG